jgi:hypothetical protein
MKHRMDTPARIHFQLVRYGSHNLHDFKWTNPFGEKLARWLAMPRGGSSTDKNKYNKFKLKQLSSIF